jgi:hypothetical protein
MTTIYVVIIVLSTRFEKLPAKAPQQAIEGWPAGMYNETDHNSDTIDRVSPMDTSQ